MKPRFINSKVDSGLRLEWNEPSKNHQEGLEALLESLGSARKVVTDLERREITTIAKIVIKMTGLNYGTIVEAHERYYSVQGFRLYQNFTENQLYTPSIIGQPINKQNFQPLKQYEKEIYCFSITKIIS